MEVLTLIFYGIILFPDLPPPPQELARFERLAAVVGDPVVVVGEDGFSKHGVVQQADEMGLTLDLGRHVESLRADSIRLVERDGDSNLDGVTKGALLGALGGVAQAAETKGWTKGALVVAGSTAIWAGIGYLFDRANRAKTVVYKR